MITTRTITPDLREKIGAIRFSCGHQSASHSFHSLFLWQKDLGLSVYLRENVFAVRCEHWKDNAWFFPCGEKEAVVELVRELISEEPSVRFLYLREEDASLLKNRFPGRFRIVPADDASEYLYDRNEYAGMPGKEYEDIRWSINHLKNRHRLRTELLSAANLEAANELLTGWTPRSPSEYFSPDRETAALVLAHYERIGINGVIVYMDDKPAAFAAGFPLTEDTYDIAFSKAPVLERGMQFYVRRELIAQLPEQYTVINGEEDLGIPGLRRSKLLENPIGRIEMFSAYEE